MLLDAELLRLLLPPCNPQLGPQQPGSPHKQLLLRQTVILRIFVMHLLFQRPVLLDSPS